MSSGKASNFDSTNNEVAGSHAHSSSSSSATTTLSATDSPRHLEGEDDLRLVSGLGTHYAYLWVGSPVKLHRCP
jgi:hypothetical protein